MDLSRHSREKPAGKMQNTDCKYSSNEKCVLIELPSGVPQKITISSHEQNVSSKIAETQDTVADLHSSIAQTDTLANVEKQTSICVKSEPDQPISGCSKFNHLNHLEKCNILNRQTVLEDNVNSCVVQNMKTAMNAHQGSSKELHSSTSLPNAEASCALASLATQAKMWKSFLSQQKNNTAPLMISSVQSLPSSQNLFQVSGHVQPVIDLAQSSHSNLFTPVTIYQAPHNKPFNPVTVLQAPQSKSSTISPVLQIPGSNHRVALLQSPCRFVPAPIAIPVPVSQIYQSKPLKSVSAVDTLTPSQQFNINPVQIAPPILVSPLVIDQSGPQVKHKGQDSKIGITSETSHLHLSRTQLKPSISSASTVNMKKLAPRPCCPSQKASASISCSSETVNGGQNCTSQDLKLSLFDIAKNISDDTLALKVSLQATKGLPDNFSVEMICEKAEEVRELSNSELCSGSTTVIYCFSDYVVCCKCHMKLTKRDTFWWHVWNHVHSGAKSCSSCIRGKCGISGCTSTNSLLEKIREKCADIFIPSEKVTKASDMNSQKNLLKGVQPVCDPETIIINDSDDERETASSQSQMGSADQVKLSFRNDISAKQDQKDSPSSQASKNVQSYDSEFAFHCCCFCSFSCLNGNAFILHLLFVHPEASIFPCRHCGQQCKSPLEVYEHYQQHAKPIQPCTFQCGFPHCCFRTNILSVLILHFNSAHQSSDQAYPCQCGESFSSENNFIQHIMQNLLSVISCRLCSAKDIKTHNILKHITERHPGEPKKVFTSKQLQCKQRYLARNSTLEEEPQRARNALQNMPPQCCESCSFVTINAEMMKEHSAVHSMQEQTSTKLDQPLKCTTCPESFNDKNEFLLHIQCHTADTSTWIYECVECKYCTNSRPYMLRHIRQIGIHKSERSEADMFTANRITVHSRVRKCSTCSFRTLLKAGMDAHSQSCSGVLSCATQSNASSTTFTALSGAGSDSLQPLDIQLKDRPQQNICRPNQSLDNVVNEKNVDWVLSSDTEQQKNNHCDILGCLKRKIVELDLDQAKTKSPRIVMERQSVENTQKQKTEESTHFEKERINSKGNSELCIVSSDSDVLGIKREKDSNTWGSDFEAGTIDDDDDDTYDHDDDSSKKISFSSPNKETVLGGNQEPNQGDGIESACQKCNYSTLGNQPLDTTEEIGTKRDRNNVTRKLRNRATIRSKKFNPSHMWRFLCKFCNFRSMTSTSLHTHLYYHLNYAPFSCSFCKERFFSKAAYFSHARDSHPGITTHSRYISEKGKENEMRCLIREGRKEAEVHKIPNPSLKVWENDEHSKEPALEEQSVIKEVTAPQPEKSTTAIRPEKSATTVRPEKSTTQSTIRPCENQSSNTGNTSFGKYLRRGERHQILYHCCLCTFSTHSLHDYRFHLAQHGTCRFLTSEKSEDEGVLQCEKCHYIATDRSDLLQHFSLDHSECLYQCGHCSFQGSNKDTIKLHMDEQHPQKPQTILDLLHQASSSSRRTRSTGKVMVNLDPQVVIQDFLNLTPEEFGVLLNSNSISSIDLHCVSEDRMLDVLSIYGMDMAEEEVAQFFEDNC